MLERGVPDTEIGRNGSSRYGDCFSARVALQERFPLDWQSLSPQELASFLNHAVVPMLESIIRTPLKELGTIPAYWFGCHCDRQACDDCWMQKNLWEAKAYPLPNPRKELTAR